MLPYCDINIPVTFCWCIFNSVGECGHMRGGCVCVWAGHPFHPCIFGSLPLRLSFTNSPPVGLNARPAIMHQSSKRPANFSTARISQAQSALGRISDAPRSAHIRLHRSATKDYTQLHVSTARCRFHVRPRHETDQAFHSDQWPQSKHRHYLPEWKVFETRNITRDVFKWIQRTLRNWTLSSLWGLSF